MQTICSAFWHHTNVRNDNKVFPCCRFKTPVDQFTGDLSTVLTSDNYEALRKDSMAGIPIAGCAKCYYEESLGKKSLRQEFNQSYDTTSIELQFLEIGFDNICNLTCDGCYEEFSSSWSKKLNPNAPKYIHIKSSNDITVVPDTVNKVLFLGGEPLMTNRHKKFLKLIENKHQVEVTYNTNGTYLFDDHTLSLLKEFKIVNVILSIDGYGELNNQVRSGSHWSDILAFIKQIKTTSFNLSIHTVIHLNNWHGMGELSDFINDQGFVWTTNILTYPKHLDVVNTPNKQECIQLIESINIPNKEYILKHLHYD
jgi:sulfatase maturation enzyme AslB (radical SAM superfamily)